MLILYNAKIRTLWEELPAAEALAIRDGHILAVGGNDQITNLADSSGQCIDLKGQTVWPGLIDAHLHLENYAASLQYVDCETKTRAECLRRVAERVAASPAGAWILGHGWNQNLWPDGFGTAAMLDEIAPHNPVYLTAKSLHICWVNSAVLDQAGITAQTPDPDKGQIGRDEQGRPDGILFEAAMAPVEHILPARTVAGIYAGIRDAQPLLWQMGLTGVHDFDRRTCFAALQQLDQAGELKLRVLKSLPLDDLEEVITVGLHSGYGSDFLRIGSLKGFSDGALGPQTAAMLAPYEDSYSNGILTLDSRQVFEAGKQAVQSGLSLAIHAIGDRANHEVLEGYRRLRRYERQQGLAPARHRIEHVQLLDPEDLGKLAALDIIASVQPIHATSDMLIAGRFWGGRSRYAYAYADLLSSGARLVFGSDAPVESPNPFWGLHAAVTRRRQDGSPSADGWYPQQRLSLASALAAFTTQAAYAAGWENCQGRLAPGYFADLIVLPDDPFGSDPQDLYRLQPSRTMVAGQWVWEGGNDG